MGTRSCCLLLQMRPPLPRCCLCVPGHTHTQVSRLPKPASHRRPVRILRGRRFRRGESHERARRQIPACHRRTCLRNVCSAGIASQRPLCVRSMTILRRLVVVLFFPSPLLRSTLLVPLCRSLILEEDCLLPVVQTPDKPPKTLNANKRPTPTPRATNHEP